MLTTKFDKNSAMYNIKMSIFTSFVLLLLNFIILMATNYFSSSAILTFINFVGLLAGIIVYPIFIWFLISIFIYMIAEVQHVQDDSGWDNW